jgi:hypothetical protein
MPTLADWGTCSTPHRLRVTEDVAAMLPRCADDEGGREVVLLTDGCVGFVSLPPSRSREIARQVGELAASAARPRRLQRQHRGYLAPRQVFELLDAHGLSVTTPHRAKSLHAQKCRPPQRFGRATSDGVELLVVGAGSE